MVMAQKFRVFTYHNERHLTYLGLMHILTQCLTVIFYHYDFMSLDKATITSRHFFDSFLKF